MPSSGRPASGSGSAARSTLPFGEDAAEGLDVQFRLRDQIGDETPAAGPVGSRHHHRLAHTGNRGERRLDLAQL
ncbi:MAG TPA: hypothetical protein VGK45_09070, partial [Thermoanaerobaculia bacterium]